MAIGLSSTRAQSSRPPCDLGPLTSRHIRPTNKIPPTFLHLPLPSIDNIPSLPTLPTYLTSYPRADPPPDPKVAQPVCHSPPVLQLRQLTSTVGRLCSYNVTPRPLRLLSPLSVRQYMTLHPTDTSLIPSAILVNYLASHPPSSDP